MTPSKLLTILISIVGLVGWVRPQAPVKAQPSDDVSNQLDYMIITVNGQRRLVRPSDELRVVTGDRVAVEEARLIAAPQEIAEVNVVGFAGRGPQAGEDRGLSLDTAHDLLPRFSEGGEGQVYAVTATTKTLLHGTVYLRLVKPVLQYAVLNVNGEARVLRDGEQASIKGSDLVKVEKVVTNISEDGEVIFQIVGDREDRKGRYEIRFSRSDSVFARIPLKVEG